ncbi:hypothetical protein [Bacillus sp. REN3]|uniref:hypothetical protein n=1 Tax=Bacillus sp. REN3 TaxID=2802440 RepID=UPI001AEE3C53|nr:hypothetical protein [Bacillus sp. REN3]
MPILISTPQDLDNIRNNLTADYELTNDIDMSSWGNWTPISYYDNVNWISGFTGNLDGKGFKIKNLTINKSTGMYLGLFGQFFYGTIQNVGLENVTVNGSNCRFASALIGYTYQATIKNCYVNGGSITSQDESGGLIGKALETNIEDSYANINMNLNTNYYGGGFLGTADSLTTVKNCYSSGFVDYTQSSPWDGISGFVGYVRNNTDVVFNNCFWDTQTSGQPSIAKISSPPSTNVTGLLGKSTAEMKTQSTYTGWDFSNTWAINSNYPTLRVFGVPIVAKKETISVNSYVANLDSNLQKNKKSFKELHTHLNQFITASERHTATKRIVEGYLSNIETTATRNARTVRSRIANVNTHIQPIESFINRESKKVNELLSFIQPIYSNVNVIYPILNKQITASISVLLNDSSVSINEGMSSIQKVINTSESIINNNQSHSAMIINPSHVEVNK